MSRAAINQTLIYMAAVAVFIFSAGPLILSFFGSILPDQSIFSFPPDWFGRGATFDNYKFILTGEIPSAYEVKGAIRSMVSQTARQVPLGIWNSTLVAGGVMRCVGQRDVGIVLRRAGVGQEEDQVEGPGEVRRAEGDPEQGDLAGGHDGSPRAREGVRVYCLLRCPPATKAHTPVPSQILPASGPRTPPSSGRSRRRSFTSWAG